MLEKNLLFCRYDVFARPWQPGQTKNDDYLGMLSEIKMLETSRYLAPFTHTKIISYPVPVKLCDDLRTNLHRTQKYLSEEKIAVNADSPPELLIKRDCIQWCFDLLHQLRTI